MDNSSGLAAKMEEQQHDSDIVKLIDSIIQIKHRQQDRDVPVNVTEAQRIELLNNYFQLEELKEKLNGKFLFEYDDGLDTFVKEVVV